MARSGKIHTGDVGTQFIAIVHDTVLNEDTGELEYPILDISDAAELVMIWTKPDGTIITRTMDDDEPTELFTDGHDGKFSFINKKASVTQGSFDIDQGDDYWQVSGYVVMSDGKKFTSDQFKFLVRAKE